MTIYTLIDENDKTLKMDAAVNVRFQPKWSYLSTILVEFLPAMIFINQSGFQVFITNEIEAFIVNNLQSISTSLLNSFELKIKGRGTVLQVGFQLNPRFSLVNNFYWSISI